MRRRLKLPPMQAVEPDHTRDAEWSDVQRRAAARMTRVDSLPLDLREIVHDFNMEGLVAAMQHGLQTSAEIREVLEIMQREGLDAAILRANAIIASRPPVRRGSPVIPPEGRLARVRPGHDRA